MQTPLLVSRRSLGGLAGSLTFGHGALAVGDDSARPADSFVESVGVCQHLGGTYYEANPTHFRALIGQSGVRYLREEVRLSNDIGRWLDLHTAFGIRSHLLVSPVTNSVHDMLTYLDAVGPRSVSAIEGQNEGDNEAAVHFGDDWGATVVAYQRAVFQALRQRYPAAMLPVVSPTLLDWKPGDVASIRATAEFCDIVALHSYVQRSQEPETQQDHAALDWYVRNYRDPFKPGAPMMVTETGYTNSSAGVSEHASSIYLPRLLLHNFGAGILRTFLYKFIDDGFDPNNNEHHYGLIRADGTPKPAYHAIRKLLGALSDRGLPALQGDAGKQAVRVDCPDAPPDLRRQSFVRRDGSVVVALWRPLRIWDAGRRLDVEVTSKQISVVTDRAVKRAECMMPNGDADWTELAITDGRISIPVSERVMLLRLVAHDV